jgi:hypothetical protein
MIVHEDAEVLFRAGIGWRAHIRNGYACPMLSRDPEGSFSVVVRVGADLMAGYEQDGRIVISPQSQPDMTTARALAAKLAMESTWAECSILEKMDDEGEYDL